MMKSILLIIALLGASYSIQAQAVFSLQTKDINGNYTSIEEVASGELIVLDFWATWCKPCVKSIPKLVELSEKYDANKVSFIGINEDSPRNTNKVKPFVHSMQVTYPVLLDPDQEIMNELMVVSYPTLIVLNRAGDALYIHEGYTTGDEKLIEEEINKVLSEHE